MESSGCPAGNMSKRSGLFGVANKTSVRYNMTKYHNALLQAPPSLDEDNFPSLATSPAPSVNGSAATAASGASPAANGSTTAVVPSNDSSPADSPRQAKDTESTSASGTAWNSPALPAAWANASGYAHKAAASGKNSGADTALSKPGASAAPRQQQQSRPGSKLQADAANFKPQSKGAANVPWVETGQLAASLVSDDC